MRKPSATGVLPKAAGVVGGSGGTAWSFWQGFRERVQVEESVMAVLPGAAGQPLCGAKRKKRVKVVFAGDGHQS